jgi:chitin disaccharide deacetylase
LKRVIFTADDFGLSPAVNAAVEQAHREGVLSSASLMVGAAAAAEAVACARRNPDLAVGLHLVVVCGRAVLPVSAIPNLVEGNGELTTNLVSAGFNYFFSRRARHQLAAEIRAQFEAFRATGLKLAHVDAHHHMHLHPTVLSLMLEIGADFGMRAVRVPVDPPSLAWLSGDGGRAARTLRTLLLTPWCHHVRKALHRRGIATADRLVGLHDTGRMHAARVVKVLRELPEGTTEIFFHPADTTLAGPWPLDKTACGIELDALVSREVRAILDSDDIIRASFNDVQEVGYVPRA